MSTPFLFVHRVPVDESIEIRDALDSLLIVLQKFIDMTAGISVVPDGDFADIKIVINIKGVK